MVIRCINVLFLHYSKIVIYTFLFFDKMLSEPSFANINSIRSANSINSVQSTRSNFDQQSKIETFHDKRISLSMAGIARLTMITNQFKDHRYTLPDVAYAKACKDLQSGEWEIETSGIEMIVAIARKNPEVGYDYIFDSIARNESNWMIILTVSMGIGQTQLENSNFCSILDILALS